jgi:hypothetical protein
MIFFRRPKEAGQWAGLGWVDAGATSPLQARCTQETVKEMQNASWRAHFGISL